MTILITADNSRIWLELVPGFYTPILVALTLVLGLSMLIEGWGSSNTKRSDKD